MKKITIFLSLILVCSVSFAQSPINLGIKVGVNSSELKMDGSEFSKDNVNNFLAGVFIRLNLHKLYVQPEAYFNSKGGDLKSIAGKSSFDLKTIDVPVLLGYKIINMGPLNVRVNAGPVFSFVTDKSIDGPSTFSTDNLKDNYAGIQYGVGADFMFLSLDIRMENSFGDVYSGNGNKAKSKAFLVTLGIKLL